MLNRSKGFYTRGRLMLSAATLLPIFTLGAVTSAHAADSATQIETVVVTAEKRPENVQNIPSSVSAFSGDQLETANITSINDLFKLIPGLGILQANNNRNTTIKVRNIGTSGTNPGIEPDVGLFMDGVYVPAMGPVQNELSDIQTVEVLRGAQGTLYGRNTPVGAVNITTRAPTGETEARLEVGFGNYDERRVNGYLGGAITDDIAGRLTLFTDSHSGTEKNIFNGGAVNDLDSYGARGRIRWTPDADTTVDLIAYFSHISTHGTTQTQVDPFGTGGIASCTSYNASCIGGTSPNFLATFNAANPLHPYVALGPHQVNEASPNFDITNSQGVSLTASRVLPFGATLLDIASYNLYADHIKELPIASLPIIVLSSQQIDNIRSYSNELRLVSPGHQFIDYVTGVYVFHDDLTYINNSQPGPGATAKVGGAFFVPGDESFTTYQQGTMSWAVYGQATVNILDNLRVVGGLRYSYDHKNVTIVGTNTNASAGGLGGTAINAAFAPTNQKLARADESVNWLGTLQYDIMEGLTAYATAGSGFKDGGFNARGAGNALTTIYTFNPETTLNYEIGVKSILFDDRLLLNLDVFRLLMHGFQQSTLNPLTGIGFIVGNAGNRTVQGVELDVQAKPIDNLTLTGNLAYNDDKYSTFTTNSCITTFPKSGSVPPAGSPQHNTPATCYYTGFRPAYSPKFTWDIGGRWEQPWRDTHYDWFIAGDVSYQGSQFLDASLDPRSFQGSVTLLNASLGVKPIDGNWQISLYGRNLTDQVYFLAEAAQAAGSFIAVNSTGTTAANGFIGWYAAPRTFGITGSIKF